MKPAKSPATITNISEAKANLSRLVAEVERGRSVILGRAGKPVAQIVPYSASQTPRKLGGSWKGKVKMSKDFDELPSKLLEAFRNRK